MVENGDTYMKREKHNAKLIDSLRVKSRFQRKNNKNTKKNKRKINQQSKILQLNSLGKRIVTCRNVSFINYVILYLKQTKNVEKIY